MQRYFEKFTRRIKSLADSKQPDVLRFVEAEMQSRKQIALVRNETGFNLELHLMAVGSRRKLGCGCKFCQSLAKYTEYQLSIHRKKKSYERFFEYHREIADEEFETMEMNYVNELEYLKALRDNAKQIKDHWFFSLGLDKI
jgi:hypothetical protein